MDQAVEEAITDGMTEVRLKISTYIDTNRVLVESIEWVAQHFDDQHYQIKYRRREEQVTYREKYDEYKYPIKHLGMKEDKTKLYKEYWIDIKW